MDIPTAYFPHPVFAPGDRGDQPLPRVFISPQRYVQGQGVLDGIGRYISLMQAGRVALLMSARGIRTEGARLVEGLASAGIGHVECVFGGECSNEEVAAHVHALADERIDCVIAAGGGKCVDAGKAVAFRLGKPVVVVPTLASNDAPCSALSVLYSSEGVFDGRRVLPVQSGFRRR